MKRLESADLECSMRNFLCLQEMTNPVLEDAELEAGIAEQVANAKAILGENISAMHAKWVR